MSIAYRRDTRTRLATAILVIWLLIGLAAAFQRGYLSGSSTNCDRVGSTVLTIVAGPLNYVGLNPRIHCQTPRPSR
jgi:hypothetical protein